MIQVIQSQSIPGFLLILWEVCSLPGPELARHFHLEPKTRVNKVEGRTEMVRNRFFVIAFPPLDQVQSDSSLTHGPKIT